jgi:HEAT repeat protein
MLADEKLNHPARFALEAMPCPESDAALIEGIKTLDGVCCVGCVNSVAMKQLPAAAGVLKSRLENCNDATLRAAIYRALSLIGADDAKELLLSKASQPDADAQAARVQGESLLNLVGQFCKAGQYDKAIAVCESIRSASFPAFIQNMALYHELLAKQSDAVALLKENLQSPDERKVNVALKTIREFEPKDAPAIVGALIEFLPSLSQDMQSRVLWALGDRQDEPSQALTFPVLKKFATGSAPQMQLVAVKGLGKVAKSRAVESFEYIMSIPVPTDADQLKDFVAERNAAFVRLDCPAVEEAIVRQFHKQNSDVNLTSLVWTIKQLRLPVSADELIALIAKPGVSAELRAECLKALGQIVTIDQLPKLAAVLAAERNDDLSTAVLSDACARMPQEQCAAKIVEAMGAATSPDDQIRTFQLLKLIGGKTALNYIDQACQNPETIDAATQILGKWSTPEDVNTVAAICLKVAKESKDKKYAVRAIRAYIRLARQFYMPSKQKFDMCKTAFQTATRPEDKALIFEVFKRVIEVESAKQAFSYASDPQYAEAAYDAVVAIAAKFQGDSPELAQMLKEIVQKSKVKATVDGAKDQINRVSLSQQDAPVEIVRATYGAGEKTVDVTKKVNEQFSGKRGLNLGGYNVLFGDVAPGQFKTLTLEIQFKATGEKRTLTFSEDEMILLPAK